MSVQRPIRLAMIGAGIFAREAHVPAALALGDAYEIVAVYSRSPESAARLNALLPAPADVYHDIPALLARQDIEAVDVLLPIPMIPEAVEMALTAGKHVISEKPMAPDVATGRRLLERYAAVPDQVWMVAENYRYEAAFVEAASVIASGEIGNLLLADWMICVDMTPANKYYHTAWRRTGDFPGGFLLDGGVHHIAALRLILGEVDRVCATVTQAREDLPPADTLSASLRFESGLVGSYVITYAGDAPWSGDIRIAGEKGSLRVTRDSGVEITTGGETRLIRLEGHRGVQDELAAFAAAVRRGEPHRNSPQEALQDVAVIEAMLRSDAEGRCIVPERIVS